MLKTLEKIFSPGGIIRSPRTRACVRPSVYGPALLLLVACACAGGATQVAAVDRVMGKMSGEPVIPRSANRIVVPDFENRSPVPSLSARVSIKVREEIARDGRLGVVDGKEEADLLLEGRILSCQVQVTEFNGAGLPVKKRIRVLASVSLVEVKTGHEIFRDADIQAFETYSELVPPISNEQAVQDRVLLDLAKRVAKKTVTGWYTELMTSEEKGRK